MYSIFRLAPHCEEFWKVPIIKKNKSYKDCSVRLLSLTITFLSINSILFFLGECWNKGKCIFRNYNPIRSLWYSSSLSSKILSWCALLILKYSMCTLNKRGTLFCRLKWLLLLISSYVKGPQINSNNMIKGLCSVYLQLPCTSSDVVKMRYIFFFNHYDLNNVY